MVIREVWVLRYHNADRTGSLIIRITILIFLHDTQEPMTTRHVPFKLVLPVLLLLLAAVPVSAMIAPSSGGNGAATPAVTTAVTTAVTPQQTSTATKVTTAATTQAATTPAVTGTAVSAAPTTAVATTAVTTAPEVSPVQSTAAESSAAAEQTTAKSPISLTTVLMGIGIAGLAVAVVRRQ